MDDKNNYVIHSRHDDGVKSIQLSVVVLSYRHGKWLGECIDSIIQQKTNFYFEIIVGDDASPDQETQDVLNRYESSYPEKIHFVRRSQNIGPSANYFDTIARAKSELVAFIDGDDLMLPGKLQAQVNFLKNNPEFSAVAHQVLTQKDQIRFKEKWSPVGPLTTRDLLVLRTPFVNSSKMFRRSMQTLNNKSSATPIVDFYVNLVSSLHGPIYCLPDYFGVYRQGVGISSDVSFRETITDSYMEAYDFAVSSGIDHAFVEQIRSKCRLSFAHAAILRGEKHLLRKFSSRWSSKRDYRSLIHKLVHLLGKSYIGFTILRKLLIFRSKIRSPPTYSS